MQKLYNISGIWNFKLDAEKLGLNNENFKSENFFDDTINLPSTTAYEKKGIVNTNRELGFLTEEYPFSGYAWFKRSITIEENLENKCVKLFLERTRKTIVWVNGNQLEEQNSLSAPHIYDISNYVTTGENELIILVNNTDYPTSGGHMTSPDTQTNWNGIIGRMEIQIFNDCHIKDIKTYPNINDKTVVLKVTYSKPITTSIVVEGVTRTIDGYGDIISIQNFDVSTDENNMVEITVELGENA